METVPPLPNTFSSGVHIPWWRIIVLALLGIACLVVCQASHSPNEMTEAGVVMDLPIFLDSFMGTEAEASLSEKTMLPGDTEILKKIYTNLDRQRVDAQIVLSGGERRSIHRPEICLPGQGWTITDGRPIAVRLANGQTQNVMKLTLERDVLVGPNDRRHISSEFCYWFVGKDKTTADHVQRVFLSSWDKVMYNINHRWAYVIVSAIVPDQVQDQTKAREDTVKMLSKFISDIAPKIQKPGVVSG